MSTPSTDRSAEPQDASSVPGLVEHFFRHEAGRLISTLARRFGLRHLDLVEEMVQAALAEALQCWPRRGIPAEPAAWIHRVARNRLLDALRHRATVLRLAPSYARLRPALALPAPDELDDEKFIADSQLRMMFVCCHPLLNRENQIALTLKSLCGFSNAEIAGGLLSQEETIKKRIQRARQQLVEHGVGLEVPPPAESAARLEAVHQCLYLLFNEGYSASHGDIAIRRDLCREAIRLGHILCAEPMIRTPATFALLALMYFHAARFPARLDAAGQWHLLEEQDRSQWDAHLLAEAERLLDLAAEGTTVTTYHLQAGIALLHCQARSFAQTDWAGILRLYNVLASLDPSPLCELNRAIVIGHVHGPSAGLTALEPLAQQDALRRSPYLHAALAESYRRLGQPDTAQAHLVQALSLARCGADRTLLERRLAANAAP